MSRASMMPAAPRAQARRRAAGHVLGPVKDTRKKFDSTVLIESLALICTVLVSLCGLR